MQPAAVATASLTDYALHDRKINTNPPCSIVKTNKYEQRICYLFINVGIHVFLRHVLHYKHCILYTYTREKEMCQ